MSNYQIFFFYIGVKYPPKMGFVLLDIVILRTLFTQTLSFQIQLFIKFNVIGKICSKRKKTTKKRIDKMYYY